MAVVFDGGRMAFPALTPVIGITSPPFTEAVLTDLPIFRVGGDLLAAVIGASPPLAFRPTADGLSG